MKLFLFKFVHILQCQSSFNINHIDCMKNLNVDLTDKFSLLFSTKRLSSSMYNKNGISSMYGRYLHLSEDDFLM